MNELKELPGASMSQAAADSKLSNEILSGGESNDMREQAMGILEPMMPYILAMKMLDMFTGTQQQQQSQNQNPLQEKITNRAVDMMLGEEQGGGSDFDRISTQLSQINRNLETGEMSEEGALSETQKQVKELSDTVESFSQRCGHYGILKGRTR